MWQKVFGAWKDFIILQTVRKAKSDQADKHCKSDCIYIAVSIMFLLDSITYCLMSDWYLLSDEWMSNSIVIICCLEEWMGDCNISVAFIIDEV